MMKDLSVKVKMLCRVCGNDEFSYDCEENELASAVDETEMTCSYCGFKTTKGDLIKDNNANIEAAVDDLTELCSKEIQKELDKALRKAFK